MEKNNMYKTSDLSIAAYLMMKGLKLHNAFREPNGQFMFEFEDPESKGIMLAIWVVLSVHESSVHPRDSGSFLEEFGRQHEGFSWIH